MDFRALSGKTVYFDTTYLKNIKGVGFVNAEYITSSLRQQLVAARCLLKDDKKDAEFVVEARIGTLGTDRHEVTYGMPANNFLSAASSLVPNSPPLPTLPELSLAKRNEQLAAAKIGAFAYHRETGEPVWQSGISPIRSTAIDTWLFGAGPFQRGDIYGGTQFAGTKLGFALSPSEEETETLPLVDYNKPADFAPLKKPKNTAKEESPTSPETKPPEQIAQPVPPSDKPPQPAVAESKSGPNPKPANAESPANPLESAARLESGLRLRIHFDDPKPAEGNIPSDGGANLFRLDPVE
jgi:hypothetical protein